MLIVETEDIESKDGRDARSSAEGEEAAMLAGESSKEG
jgi:hypothetical protein